MAEQRLEALIRRVRCLPESAISELEKTVSCLENGTSPATNAVTEPRGEKSWPHAPTHQISEKGTFLVTAGTYQKRHHFREPARLDLLEDTLLTQAAEYGWDLEAWAVFSNHYHFVGHSEVDPVV